MRTIIRTLHWAIQALCFLPGSLFNGLIVSTIPIVGLAVTNGVDTQAKALIDSLTPMNVYFMYALFPILIFSQVPHFNHWLTKQPKIRIKLSNNISVNYLKLVIVKCSVSIFRLVTSFIDTSSKLLTETFLGIATTLTGVYIAQIVNMIFVGDGYCADNNDLLWQVTKQVATYALLTAMTMSSIKMSKNVT